MSRLGPEARALIEEASQQETLPSERALRRVRRSVALKAMAAGAAVATGSSTLGAKASLLGAGVAVQIASLVVAGALTGGALVAVSPAWRAPAPRRADPSAHVRTGDAPTSTDSPRSLFSPDVEPPGKLPPVEARVTSTQADSSARGSSERGPSGQPFAGIEPPPRPMGRWALPLADGAAETGPRDRSNRAAPAARSDPHPAERPMHSLALELEILREARKKLGEGHAPEVLELLGKYDDLFRGGALEEESRTARIAALCQLGRYEQARIDIADALRRWPNSPIAQMASDCR